MSVILYKLYFYPLIFFQQNKWVFYSSNQKKKKNFFFWGKLMLGYKSDVLTFHFLFYLFRF